MRFTSAHRVPLEKLNELYQPIGLKATSIEACQLITGVPLARGQSIRSRLDRFLAPFATEQPIRPTEEVLVNFTELTFTYPWLGKIALINDSYPPRHIGISWTINNHVTDDNPLPFGMSLSEAHEIRGALENDNEQYLAVLENACQRIKA